MPTLADQVAEATGPNAHPRTAFVMASLVRHLHAFATEVNLTHDEWMAGIELINEAGRISTTRNETQLLCDVLGFESLIDGLAAAAAAGQSPAPASTPSAILGPFYKDGAPVRSAGEPVASASVLRAHASQTARVRGRVLSAQTGQPIPGAIVDVWHAGPDGLYGGQVPASDVSAAAPLEPADLRGVFRTDGAGAFDMLCLRPGPYPVPQDGPVGRLLRLLDRHPWRPAHLHFKVSAAGFHPLTTQLFDAEDAHLRSDTVFAVKDDLKVQFRRSEGDASTAAFYVDYDFKLEVAK